MTITSFPLRGSLSVESTLSGQIKRASHGQPVVDPIMQRAGKEMGVRNCNGQEYECNG